MLTRRGGDRAGGGRRWASSQAGAACLAGASPADPDLAAFDVKCGRVGRERLAGGSRPVHCCCSTGRLALGHCYVAAFARILRCSSYNFGIIR